MRMMVSSAKHEELDTQERSGLTMASSSPQVRSQRSSLTTRTTSRAWLGTLSTTTSQLKAATDQFTSMP